MFAADQEQVEEALAMDLQQMKIRLQGTPGTARSSPQPISQYTRVYPLQVTDGTKTQK
jgi:hypothetical protein